MERGFGMAEGFDFGLRFYIKSLIRGNGMITIKKYNHKSRMITPDIKVAFRI